MNQKSALVVGATGDIGAQVAKTLSQIGHSVFITGRDEKKLQALESTLENCSGRLTLDLLQADAVLNLNKEFFKANSKLDLLVNCAGSYEWQSLERYNKESSKTFRALFYLNAIMPFELCVSFMPGMPKHKNACVLNVGSISGIVGEVNASAYSASKASLLGLTKSLALEYAASGVRINLISPAWVKGALLNKSLSEEEQKQELETVPMGQWITPQEIADLVVYLASDSARSITGQNFSLCAGASVC
jgi:short-subunit dehydrogenase